MSSVSMFVPLFSLRYFNTILLASVCGVLLFLFSASYTYAADIFVSPSSGAYSVGQTFTVSISVDPKTDKINSADGVLAFSPSQLSVVSVSKSGLAFSIWPVEPTFSNSAGTVTFGGGHTAPISNRSTILSVTFRAVAAGTGTVSFSRASVLAADGLGTNVLKASPGGSFTISQSAAPTETETETPTNNTVDDTEGANAAIAFGDPPRAPEVGSQAFLDPDLWYRTVEGIFTWDLPFDVNAIRVEMATSSDNIPSEVYDPPIDEFVVSRRNLEDGIQYLSVQFKNQVGWGAVTNRPVKIDTTAPENFKIGVQTANSKTGFPLLTFEAYDSTSGVAYYELYIADREPVKITTDEAKLGYLISELEDGTYTARVVAFDQAGNSTESTVPVLITAGWTKAADTEEQGLLSRIFTPVNMLIAFLVTALAFALGYIFYERKRSRREEERLRKETREIQDQMEKIFSALRDEIYDQINLITKRPRLSKKEKEAVEGLTQALEVSETLIEKEINDVKKILK